jgi:hypothetical protein
MYERLLSYFDVSAVFFAAHPSLCFFDFLSRIAMALPPGADLAMMVLRFAVIIAV